MNIDKIKYILGEQIFNFWAECKDFEKIKNASKTIDLELKNNLVPSDLIFKYKTELLFLNYLLN